MKPAIKLKNEESSPKIYSVTQLNRDVRHWLEGHYANILVEAEISNLKLHSSGHIYLSLKDDKAQISAVFFSRYNQRLKFQIKDGLKVLVRGKLSLYDVRGQYQFYIETMEPQGLGSLQLAFMQLKEKLQGEGLFDAERKRALPVLPRRVGIVTSPTGAAIRDILNVLNRRFAGLHLQIYPVRVQGEEAAAEIAAAIENLNHLAEVDVMIVGRGGGSLEDLWPFNEEAVARAIFNSKIPVISAVGHEVDWTISDWVADLRAPTPSAAAELVVQSRDELIAQVEGFKYRLNSSLKLALEQRKRHLETLLRSYALRQPEYMAQQCSQRLDELMRQMGGAIKMIVSNAAGEYKAIVGKLETLSPLGIIRRGYTITQNSEGRLLRSTSDIKEGDQLKTQFRDGACVSQVVSIEKTEK